MEKKTRQTKLRTYKFNFVLLQFFSGVLQGQSNPWEMGLKIIMKMKLLFDD